MDPMTVECWTALANAVILQAAEDYADACRRSRLRPTRQSEARRRSLEKFFTSRWFRTLSGTDGEALMKRIREEQQKQGTKQGERIAR